MSQSICPICKSTMTYNYNGITEHYSCDKKIDHSYSFSYHNDSAKDVCHFLYGKNKQHLLIWKPNKNTLFFIKQPGALPVKIIPYFKPNFNNYKKTINQIKIWLTFQ